MFCEKCGKELDNTAEFCGFCGAKVTRPVSPETPEEKPEKPVYKGKSVINKIIVIEAVAFILLVIGMVLVPAPSPDDVMNRYLTAYVNGDYKTMFKMIDLDGLDSDFTTEESIGCVLAAEEEQTSSYELESAEYYKDGVECDDIDDADEIVYTCNIDTSSTEGEEVLAVLFKLSKQKNTVFHSDEWKIKPYVVEGIKLNAVEGAKVYFDGVELTEKYLSEPEIIGGDTYKLPPLSEGAHICNISKEGMETRRQRIEIKEDSQSITTKILDLDVAQREQLFDDLYEDHMAYLDALFNLKDFEEIEEYMPVNQPMYDEAKEKYEDTVKYFKECKENGKMHGSETIRLKNYKASYHPKKFFENGVGKVGEDKWAYLYRIHVHYETDCGEVINSITGMNDITEYVEDMIYEDGRWRIRV